MGGRTWDNTAGKADSSIRVSLFYLTYHRRQALNINWASSKHVCNIYQKKTFAHLSFRRPSRERWEKKLNSKSLRAGFKSEPKGGRWWWGSDIFLFETLRFEDQTPPRHIGLWQEYRRKRGWLLPGIAPFPETRRAILLLLYTNRSIWHDRP